jgi:hypothetical protein
MPTGVPISSEKRALLVHHKLQKRSDVDFVVENLFLPGEVQIDTIKRIWHNLDTMDEAQINGYISGTPIPHVDGATQQHGIPAGSEAEDFIVKLLKEHRSMRLRVVTAEFHKHFYDQYEGRLPGMSAVYQAIKRTGLTHKRVTWQNIHRNPDEQAKYLDDMMSIHPDLLADLDGMVEGADDWYEHFGWSPAGEQCIRFQIELHGGIYAVMAAYSTKGFLFYRIFGDTVKGSDISTFLEDLGKSGKLPHDAFMILDNAKNQKTEKVRDTAERVFNGRYMYCSAYSPELKPIERGFSNVKNYIRERDGDAEWQSNPVGLIMAAFNYYSVDGEGGPTARNHFQIYFDNHQMFLDLM